MTVGVRVPSGSASAAWFAFAAEALPHAARPCRLAMRIERNVVSRRHRGDAQLRAELATGDAVIETS